jgi:hypothetical protein
MTLKRNETPPGGWKYHQPETNWNMPNPVAQSWESAVQLIQKHREANAVLKKIASVLQVEKDLEAFTLARFPQETKSLIQPDEAPRRKGCRTCGSR